MSENNTTGNENADGHFFTDSRKEVEQYLQDRLLLIKMQTTEKMSRLVALLFSGIIIALLSFFILLFLSIMAGYFFAAITGSLYTGFAIVTAFYVILLLAVIGLRKRYEKRIVNTVIRIFFDKNNDDDVN